MFKKILGYKIFSGTKDELYDEIMKREKVHIISGNSEILHRGLKNKELFDIYNNKDSIIIADGIGTIMASRILKNSVGEKIAGIDFMEYLIRKSTEHNLSIYLLGGEKDVVKNCFYKLRKKYREVNIVGFHHGYFNVENCDEIIDDINSLGASILFVAMGNPKQELFIDRYKEKLNCKIFMGVGGSFDVFSEKVKRAPRLFIKLNLEWIYRTIKEPRRILRLKEIPLFLILALKERRKE